MNPSIHHLLEAQLLAVLTSSGVYTRIFRPTLTIYTVRASQRGSTCYASLVDSLLSAAWLGNLKSDL